MRKLLIVLALVFVAFALAACGNAEDADCNAGAKDKCTSNFTTCTTACALQGDQECADDCAADKCACLEEAGCPCN